MRSQDREWVHEVPEQGVGSRGHRTGSGFMRSQDREWIHEVPGHGVGS